MARIGPESNSGHIGAGEASTLTTAPSLLPFVAER